MTDQHQAAIRKVWKEALSTEEKLILLEQLTRNEAGWKVFLQQQYEQDLHNGKQYLPLKRSEQLLQQLHERIRLTDEAATCMGSGSKLVGLRPRILRWAIGTAAAMLIIAGFYYYPSNRKTGNSNNVLALYKPKREYKRYINRSGTEEKLVMSDGSQLKLAPGAAIVWIDGFTEDERNIRLSGKGWFDVAKDSRRPFSVSTANITTTALGTKFLVDAQRNRQLSVQLFEGKVKIESMPGEAALQTIFLEPGQQCIIDAQLQAVVGKLTDTRPAAETIAKAAPGQSGPALQRIKPLEFVQTPLVDVLAQLGHRYKVHFKYDPSAIRNDQVTGTFLASDSLNVTLNLLQLTNNLFFHHYQDTIQVSKMK